MERTQGTVIGINANLVKVRVEGVIVQNEIAYVKLEEGNLKGEVIRIKGDNADLQIFESTTGLQVGNRVEFTGELLSSVLGPGLLGQVYDGLQNPLDVLAEQTGFFIPRGYEAPHLNQENQWDFTPKVKVGDQVRAGDSVGSVPENAIKHKIMVPFDFKGVYEVIEIAEPGNYTILQPIAKIKDRVGEEFELTMAFNWPVKLPIRCYEERLKPTEPMSTQVRIVDALFPVAKGGTYCIPGPFGAGKTVLQQITSRYAEVDIVIIAACGERANEVVETIKEFPELSDPKTGRTLMERTIIICNTSSMPVAARESSVYTAVTLAEYYRQMGLDVLLLADSTSRWAQALRERSGRLEEIPGEEAFPAYLESLIANFYERAGIIRLRNGEFGSVTIGGTVSPAGGNFEEPVTKATLKVVGAFHALSRERSDARRFPAIHPLESWSKYRGIIPEEGRKRMSDLLKQSNQISQMMKVVGEEGTTIEDYVTYLKGELFDEVFLQQNAFHDVDAATPQDRQSYTFDLLTKVLDSELSFVDKSHARNEFHNLRQLFLDYNFLPFEAEECKGAGDSRSIGSVERGGLR